MKKKICWLAHESNMSGANIALLEYIDVLTDEYDFHIILPHEGNMTAALIQRNINCTIIPQYSWATSVRLGRLQQSRIKLRSVYAVAKTKQLLKLARPDFVFTNTQVPFTAAQAAYQLGIPHIWWVHEFGEQDFGIKIGWGNTANAYKKMKRWSKLVICNSLAVTEKFRAVLPGTDVQCLYQPVSFNSNLPLTFEKKARYLMFGQIIPSKGHLEVLEAIVQSNKINPSRRVSLHIIGPAEDKNYLEELHHYILTRGMSEQVKIEVGFFDKEKILPSYELLILASKAEAFGRVIVEANKAGLRAIVRNNGGAPEQFNETYGLLFVSAIDLAKIMAGEIPMPSLPIRENYSETTEIRRLKTWLSELG
jgi:glycosyltransferase involved in cell wall biosynthesis